MTDRIPPDSLSAVSEVMLATLYTHAPESRRPDALIEAPWAEELVDRIDYYFARSQMNTNDQVVPSLRPMQLDLVVQIFPEAHPDSVVSHIGCGLDTRFERVCAELPDSMQELWYDLDLLPVINLGRNRKLAEAHEARAHRRPPVHSERFLGPLSNSPDMGAVCAV